jgi:hypothetical protein
MTDADRIMLEALAIFWGPGVLMCIAIWVSTIYAPADTPDSDVNPK